MYKGSKILIITNDRVQFEVNERLIQSSRYVKSFITTKYNSGHDITPIYLKKTSSNTFERILEYCMQHIDDEENITWVSSKISFLAKLSNTDKWDQAFLKANAYIINELIQTSKELLIPSLTYLTIDWYSKKIEESIMNDFDDFFDNMME